ncbi:MULTISPECIES: mannose-1-phosphate guanylyltransferase/mannose-6-phosphate isomerase [Ramlibacter]|uniref:mannose-1-phosphate guanylyltransferase n=1 Tax=Ramlibacter aquaticus TaxID=2780094 RepID=A0ABR9SI05_9BURK|nr:MULTISPECIES: mannose-1-phosphate guanylyltransferase/mannose-6-phosphate isomerase [Ramlibacter]MBE7941994.1 mannose-1-phosphate guanylyltransferase/mannose-6-phosphate isomerase [Ramlibacter aquaticus]
MSEAGLVSVILSGGAGTRLWPASRLASPKPFMRLGGETLLGQAIRRGQACGTDELLLVTNHEHELLSREVLAGFAQPPHCHMLLETRGRNTAPALALAALHVAQTQGPGTLMLVLAADHLVPDTQGFVACAHEAMTLAREGRLVLFGVQPTHPDTGFGYVEVASLGLHSQPVLRFVEKPDLETAASYLATGRYYWNSGMFCFSAQTLLDALAAHAPLVLAAARDTMASRAMQGDHSTFDAARFALQPDISIDYAVMERAPNVTVIPARFAWSDVGSWPAVAQAHTPDSSGNTFEADVVAVDTHNTHVQVDSHAPKVVATVGVQDLVVVDTPDALLVVHKDSAQKVKSVVDALRARGHESIHLPPRVQRPWGSYATLKEEHGYKVKRIWIKPGESISLQYHQHRAEHWIVVQGLAQVRIGDQDLRTEAGQYRHVPAGQTHRLKNIGTEDLVVIEVQCGGYLGEDDIVRLADDYGRT